MGDDGRLHGVGQCADLGERLIEARAIVAISRNVGRSQYGQPVPKEANQLKRRNHTVNCAYLLRFADERRLLSGVELPGDRRFPVSAEKATMIKNFYVIRRSDGSECDQAEDDFCAIESSAAAGMKVLIDQRTWPVPNDVRADIAMWAALHYLRVPRVRQLAREIAGAYIEVGVPFTSGTGERTTLRMPAEDADPEKIKRLHLAFIERNTPVVAKMLYDRDWELRFFSRKSLATSDSPVILRPMITYPDGTTVTIADAAEVQVPLDRRVALSMTATSRGDRRLPGSARTAADLNKAVANNARRFLFHHPSDNPLNGLALPQPRPRELSSPEAAVALVADLSDLRTPR